MSSSSQSTSQSSLPLEMADMSPAPLEKVPTRTSLATAKPLPPVDVGVMPWLQVLGGFFLMFNTWGTVVAFGTFQSYYEANPAITGSASPSSIAWIGSLQAFLLLFVGALCGRLFDAGYLRTLLLTGSFLIVFGLMTTSLCTTYSQLILAQGICVGIGMGCLLVPSVGTPSTWFAKHRGLAIGFVTLGSAIGGIVLPIMVQKLILEIGFPWAVRTLGFLSLATLSVSVAVMRSRLPPRRRGAFFEYRALAEPEFTLYASGMLVALLGFYVFYVFIQPWTIATHLPTHGLNPLYLLPIMNAASIFGRTLPNLLSDTVGPLNVQVPCVLVAGVLTYAWLGVHTLPPLLVVSILYGFFSGALISLPPAAVARLTRDMSRFGGRMGIVFLFMSVGSLVGSPVTGAIIQGSHSVSAGYDGARIWSGTTLVLGAGLMGLSRAWVSRRRGEWAVRV